jgi:hypothetical protein
MTAFDLAWSLMKMPITSSITDEKVLGGIRQRADFTDPKTNEVMDLQGYDLGDEIMINMKNRDNMLVGRIYDTPGNEYRQTHVDEGLRRRGIGTALYDMLAHLYAKRGFEVKPTKSSENYNLPALTADGTELWGDKETWPARDDL